MTGLCKDLRKLTDFEMRQFISIVLQSLTQAAALPWNVQLRIVSRPRFRIAPPPQPW